MSRKSIKEYILRKRDDYLGETPKGKTRMLDEIDELGTEAELYSRRAAEAQSSVEGIGDRS